MLISRKAANKVAGNRDDSQPVSAKLYITNLITRRLSTRPPPLMLPGEASVRVPDEMRGGEGLIFSKSLLPEERRAAEVLVMRCPQFAQAMLDELAARMDINAIRLSPIGYLRGMIKRAQAGDFVPELGVRVAATRSLREVAAALREKEEAEGQRLSAERANPEYQARIARHREEIHQILKSAATRKTQGQVP